MKMAKGMLNFDQHDVNVDGRWYSCRGNFEFHEYENQQIKDGTIRFDEILDAEEMSEVEMNSALAGKIRSAAIKSMKKEYAQICAENK
ncbi:hypothetical protein KKC32_03310 [Patescibacteria group bacterium]|nr:hypothetical protein [Patescibacteria group bacterium]